MPRSAASLDAIVKTTIEGVVQRTASSIAKAISSIVAARVAAELKKNGGKPGRRGMAARPRAELTKWVADRRARRVPTFVIELTGLKTKKAVVAKYGENAAFEKGKTAPKAK